MELTTAQKATLKTAIQADPAANALYVDGNLGGLADYLNQLASPAVTFWKTRVSIEQVGDNINAAELAGLSTLNSTRLQTLVALSPAGVNPSVPNRRAFFDDIFSGAGGVNTRAALLALWKRQATRFENVFKVGTGTDVAPASPGFDALGAYLLSPISYTLLQGL